MKTEWNPSPCNEMFIWKGSRFLKFTILFLMYTFFMFVFECVLSSVFLCCFWFNLLYLLHYINSEQHNIFTWTIHIFFINIYKKNIVKTFLYKYTHIYFFTKETVWELFFFFLYFYIQNNCTKALICLLSSKGLTLVVSLSYKSKDALSKTWIAFSMLTMWCLVLVYGLVLQYMHHVQYSLWTHCLLEPYSLFLHHS